MRIFSYCAKYYARVNKFSIIFLGLSFLVSCSTVQQPVHYIPNPARTQALRSLDSWQANGAMAINTDQEHVQASFSWQQTEGTYVIDFYGPLGTYHHKLFGSAHDVTLVKMDGQPVHAKSPERLLQRLLGWHLPVNGLKYWIRGIAAPGSVASKSFDQFGRLATLEQQNWHITYQSYQNVDGIDLPKVLILRYPSLKVKIVLSGWTLKNPPKP